MNTQAIQIWVVSIRWSIDYGDYELRLSQLKAVLQRDMKKFCGQLELTMPDGPFDEECIANANYHFQVFARFKAKKRPKAYARSINGECRGIAVRTCSTAGVAALERYCLKEDTAVRGTQFADHPIYAGQDLPSVWRPFQQALIDYCLSPWKKREIVWVYDPLGHSGKSDFRKFMDWKHQALCLDYDSTEGLKFEFCKATPPPAIVIFNLTRTKPKQIANGDLYAALEAIKDGHCKSSKYAGSSFLGFPPNVVVLSNELPDEKCLTNDRFKIKGIDRTRWELYDYVRRAPAPAYLTERRNVLNDMDTD